MTSNYNDSGYSYTNTSGTSSNASSTDIYNVVNTCGVYFLNGTRDSGLEHIYPIVCSTLLASGMRDIDDGFIVYPGYAIQIFYTNFSDGTNNRSYIYCNYSSRPVLYTLANSDSGTGSLIYPIDYYNNNSSTTLPVVILLQNNNNCRPNNIGAIRVWFRGTEVLLTNSSSSCTDTITDSTRIRIYT